MKGFLKTHPVIDIRKKRHVDFFYRGERFSAPEGIALSSALMANGIDAFGTHYRDGLPQGIFCANGQCAQCLVLADGVPVKACITPLRPDMRINPVTGLGDIKTKKTKTADSVPFPVLREECDVLVVGGGPAGLSAAAVLGKHGLSTVLVDDKPELGGKLTLQTHQFFGSVADCYAGSRGMDIAQELSGKISKQKNVKVHRSSTAVAVFEDLSVGIRSPDRYFFVRPKALLNAAGARERTLCFPGSYLPNVYGAGAFQTLLNRDLVKAARRLLVVGSGNVGLIAAYHALQADIGVVCVLEALPEVTGYRVHSDKIRRLGVPILTSHTIEACYGDDRVRYAEFAAVDGGLKPIPGTSRCIEVDAVLIGVGLVPVNELAAQARAAGMPVFEAGDAKEVSEASAAFFSGRLAAGEVVEHLTGRRAVSPNWRKKMEVLKSKPGESSAPRFPKPKEGFMPVLHCYQRIPCNPCLTVCPENIIHIPEDDLLEIPVIRGTGCIGCFQCVAFCPGLALTLVRNTKNKAFVYIPYEMNPALLTTDREVELSGHDGEPVGKGTVRRLFSRAPDKKRSIVEVETNPETAVRAAGIRLFGGEIKTVSLDREKYKKGPEFVCLCEHITRQELEAILDGGITDVNLMKAEARVTMGACGGKTCGEQIKQMMRDRKTPE
ncbi:MAG: FAD-dependent oxidoreductase, partial [Spirochaetes bacterium]|nr:FAD-dependent oxidoreductase [Spirochaetota bacterium]